MKILSIQNTDKVIQAAVLSLKNGDLVIFPTETSYGIASDATNSDAINKLLKYKQRPPGKAISIAVNSKNMALNYVELNNSAEKIIDTFLPGPITVISKSLGKVDERLESEIGTLGIRIPNYKLVLDIIKVFGKPITATSANISGGKTPYSINDVLENIPESKKELLDLVIDAGELPKNPPSTVIDTTSDDLKIYRQGRVDPERMTVYGKWFTNSYEETILLAKELINKIKSENVNRLPMTFLLSGELGAGKTHFTKGIAKGLGITQIIKSPTYTYVSEYKISDNSKLKTENYLYHFDAWRIQTKEDLEALRFYEWFKDGNVIVIEWPSVAMALDENFFEGVEYYYVDFIILGEDKREIRVYRKN
ncbi:MAG: L-threonylcarbamoyladenylate synthase [Candidatus Dojkabacteria bacterium]